MACSPRALRVPPSRRVRMRFFFIAVLLSSPARLRSRVVEYRLSSLGPSTRRKAAGRQVRSARQAGGVAFRGRTIRKSKPTGEQTGSNRSVLREWNSRNKYRCTGISRVCLSVHRTATWIFAFLSRHVGIPLTCTAFVSQNKSCFN